MILFLPEVSKPVSFLLPILAILIAFGNEVLADDKVRSEAVALVANIQKLEDSLLKGVRWSWGVEKGRSEKLGKSWYGMPKFDTSQPVDEYRCEWLSNQQTMLLSQIAKQPQRILSNDEKAGIISMTSRPYFFLQTAQSCLVADAPQPDPIDRKPMPSIAYCRVGNRELGNTSSLQPGMFPLHAASFGLKKLHVLLKRIEAPDNHITIEDATTDLGRPARLVRIIQPSGFQMDYYFEIDSLLIVQRDQFFNDKLRGKAIVVKTLAIGNSESSVSIPSEVVVWFGKDKGSWHIARYRTSSAALEVVPLDEIKIDVHVENPTFQVMPPPGYLPARMIGLRQITGAGLDEFVQNVIQTAKETTLEKFQRQKAKFRVQ